MSTKYFSIYFLLLLFTFAHSQSNTDDNSTIIDDDESNLKDEWSYCFDFTWFGPDYDNITRYNGTCGDYLEETRAPDDVPCAPPIVISYDGTTPDIDYLWKHHKASVLCRQSDNQVCVSYKYLFGGKVNNATYMCAKVQTQGHGTTTSGCFKEKKEGYDVEMCVCKSTPGTNKRKPCNSASLNFSNILGICFCTLIVYIRLLFS